MTKMLFMQLFFAVGAVAGLIIIANLTTMPNKKIGHYGFIGFVVFMTVSVGVALIATL